MRRATNNSEWAKRRVLSGGRSVMFRRASSTVMSAPVEESHGLTKTISITRQLISTIPGYYTPGAIAESGWSLYGLPGWTPGIQPLQTLPPTMTTEPLGKSAGGYGGTVAGTTGNGGFSFSSIPSWVWIGAAVFGGVVLLKGKGKTGGGGSMIPKNFKFKTKVK